MDVDVEKCEVEEVAEEEEVTVEDAERRVSLVVTRRPLSINTHPLEDTSREAINWEVGNHHNLLQGSDRFADRPIDSLPAGILQRVRIDG